MASIFDLASVQ